MMHCIESITYVILNIIQKKSLHFLKVVADLFCVFRSQLPLVFTLNKGMLKCADTKLKDNKDKAKQQMYFCSPAHNWG